MNYSDFAEHNYQVLQELGRNREGGRISYLAECKNTQQQVVIKQFCFAQESSWQGFKTYEREIQILQEIDHPRIPQYLDSFETDDGFCMVQEYKNAPSLASKKSFTPAEIKQITASILEILVDLQQRLPPIIHRDIKPENILVNDQNQAYLIDFGLARIHSRELAMSSVVAGTPGFMPPEELFNRPLTKTSDLYSVGATAIALITNTPAAKLSDLIDDNYQLQFQHLLTGINPDFIGWLKQMVAPNLKDRFSNAQVALAKLKPIDITGKSTVSTPVKKENKLAIAVASGAVLMILGSLLGIFYEFRPVTKTAIKSVPKPITRSKPPSYSRQSQWIQSPHRQPVTMEQKRFREIKPRCNAVEVVTAMNNTSYPKTPQGVGYAASCYALAGRLDLADKIIKELPQYRRSYAAEVLFNVAHPVADEGDDRSAAPIMNLVIRYWTENYMALYHGGMSAYVLGDYAQAEQHLQAFLNIYQRQDGWTNRAQTALSRMKQNIPADKSFSIHH